MDDYGPALALDQIGKHAGALTPVRKEHLETLLALSQAINLDERSFHCLSVALENTQQKLVNLSICSFLDIVKEQKEYQTFLAVADIDLDLTPK